MSSSSDLDKELVRVSLLAYVVNLCSRTRMELHSQHYGELLSLRQTHADLEKGRGQLGNLLGELQAELDHVGSLSVNISEKASQLAEQLAQIEVKTDQPIDIDEVVDTTAPLYRH
ncbi:unnamed protein product [Protopolystoma xenopodis]|uniref:Uncharacterized protein n=1 Tax=Protopolystoma xenopodis TaxID=117903 RepID=A0A448WF61_9PLAT|nr:unnamed protein product [Protopolystoma xenopodis]